MRIAFVGAGDLAVRTARTFIADGYEVVIIDKDRATIDSLAESMDCSFLEGDGSNPDILKEVGPKSTDFLFCLSNSDQDNILASLVGRSLGFKRVVTSIENTAFEDICTELGLTDTILPARTISRYLADMVKGGDTLELSTVLRGKARLFTFTAGTQDQGSVADLKLPADAKAVCLYRGEEFHLLEAKSPVREGDSVVVLTVSDRLAELRERWIPAKRGDPATAE